MSKKDIWIFVGQRIKLARKINNITVEELASRLNTSTSMVWRWSSGHTGLSVPRLLEVAKALEVEPIFLISDYEENICEEKNDILGIIKNLSNAECKKLLPSIKSIIEII